MFGKGKVKKDLNRELDLVAFISMLSMCICFLLVTTIWIQIGVVNVKQAVGGQPAEGEPKPEMWVVFSPEGELSFELRHSPAQVAQKYSNSKIAGVQGRPDYTALGGFLEKLTVDHKALSVALIRPSEKTPFQDIIELMDVFRQKGIGDLGVTPL